MAPKAVLVGMPGSGKSTIGRRLSKALGVSLLDTDAAIEQRTGRTIADIFATDGEQEFRRIEEEVVRAALAEHDGVLSLGGGAVMGIQAIKGVEIGDGFETARRRGSRAHDEMYPGPDGVVRSTNRAGGLEGGMTNGQPLRVRAAMKPISTVPRALATVDMATGDEAVAIHQRSDVCAVPAAGVVVEAMVALVLARAALQKFGGDSLAETRRNVESYRQAVAEREAPAARGTA